MKITKSILTAVLLLVLGLTSQVKSQGIFDDKDSKKNKSSNSSSGDGGKCFNEDTKIINLGVGFLGANYHGYNRYNNYSSSPALSISYEQAIPQKVGPGYLGVGAYFGFKSARYEGFYDDGDYYYKHHWKSMFIAARAAYHLDALNFDKGEVYFGLALGVRIQTYDYESNHFKDDKRNQHRLYYGSNAYLGSSLFIGGRYYLSKNIGVFGELGYGISYATLGLSFKF